MCGIAGWADFKQDISAQRKTILDMTDTLRQRGPDSEGEYISPNVLLGHRRLIVVDPEGGGQPMVRTEGENEYVTVYNGELYNTEELRAELKDKGYSFKSYSDTEVLLTSYICWGPDCVKKFNGIFAFAVYDKSRRRIFLARDPLGVKPLFYTLKGGALIFGSEIKTLLAHPQVEAAVDREGIAELFALGPASIPGSGVYKGIYEIPPANCAVFTPDDFRLQEYWRPTAEEFHENEKQAAEHLRFLFTDAVKRQLVGDVPLCTFLSGGLDSSAICAVAAEEFRKKGETLTTYSIDYTENDKYFKASLFQPTSDQQWALRMADTIHSHHITVVEDQIELAEKLREAVLAKDLPGMADIDSSLYIFCREIRNNFVIALSGECADDSEHIG